jgi:hypothetical protein
MKQKLVSVIVESSSLFIYFFIKVKKLNFDDENKRNNFLY